MDHNTNNKAIEIVVYYLNLIKSETENLTHLAISKGSANYLVRQTVRQLNLPRDSYRLSVEAKKTWDSISSKEIFEYWYTNPVTSENPSKIVVPIYKGARKLPDEMRTLNKGDKFHFRQVFHDDHIIPIKLIMKKLLELKDPDYENVTDILKDMSVCRMLKEEDRRIKEKSSRVYNEKEIIENLYMKEYGIEIVNYNYTLKNNE